MGGIRTSLPLARTGVESGRWKQASLIWLELGSTYVSKTWSQPFLSRDGIAC